MEKLARLEERFGPLGEGAQSLEIGGKTYSLWDLLKALGLINEGGLRPIDAVHLEAEGLYAIRYLDILSRSVIAYEFYPDFRYHKETRLHLADILGEEEYHNLSWELKCAWGI